MNIFFDLNHILNGSYPVDQDILAILRTECKKKPDDFSNKVDLIWKYISCLYADELNTIFELSDEIFKKQLANEIFLRLYNTLSTFTSEKILGAENFLENTLFNSAEKRLTYKDKKSFNSFVKHLIPIPTKEHLVTSLPGESTTLLGIPSLKNSDLIMDYTPLSEFIYTHLIYKGTDKECDGLLPESNRNNNKVNFYFNKEGRYFLSVLLLAVASKDIPYTSKTLLGSSLNSINNLFDTLYYAYHQKELTIELQEKFLFLINAESVFQCSLLNGIFSTLAEYFNTTKDNALPIFISSIPFITLLSSYPLNVAKIKIWNFLSENNFSNISEDIYDKSNNGLEKVDWQWIPSMQTINDMVDCFIYTLFYIDGFFDNPDSDFFNTLKKDIFKYLSESGHQDMQWSLLSSTEKIYTKIPSTFNEYFNFYILYYFYNIRFNSTNSNWSTKDLEYSFNWPGYNLYAKYLLNHKK